MRSQWAAMEDLYRDGKARAIGVSNYCEACLECLVGNSSITPHVNQIRIHAGMDALVRKGGLPAYCSSRGIVLQAYSPLGGGSGAVLENAMLKEIATAQNASTAQVALRWLLQHQIPSITYASASSKAYLVDDLRMFQIRLLPRDMQRIDGSTFANESPVKAMCFRADKTNTRWA